jgi:hypothetical protein
LSVSGAAFVARDPTFFDARACIRPQIAPQNPVIPLAKRDTWQACSGKFAAGKLLDPAQ